MKRNEKLERLNFALKLLVPAVEIFGFISLLRKSIKQEVTRTEDKRKLPKWAIVLNIALRVVLISAYIDEYKKKKAKEPVYNEDCEFWNFCDEDCSECAYNNAFAKSVDNATDADSCVDCVEDCTKCSCNNDNCVIKQKDFEQYRGNE